MNLDDILLRQFSELTTEEKIIELDFILSLLNKRNETDDKNR